ncbi:DHA2 family efflux MFS transporter permease subunit [Agrobacterium sp. Ap1]|uniref:DHA2 family efflux MFS transporter permease subunit n=1 Tax=Agrobacterium sp. Ap1 TaxID=2815337 RepID=UPI001A8D3307|nr:DHA2 family efflux MFS transporter permease subunit [Agrobacterium sp. Ap1]
MTTAPVAITERERTTPGTLLVVGIVLAALTEAVASTVLSLGRGDIIGDTYATPDEFAWLDIGYTAAKLIGFILASWFMTRMEPRRLVIAATLIMGAACGIAALTNRLELLTALRVCQGMAGGVLLVAGQTLILVSYPRYQQPILQALFAMGSVVAPATIAPALQGWLLDSYSWVWIFLGVVPLSIAAIGCLLITDGIANHEQDPSPSPFDWAGVSLISISFFCLTYVLSQGSRWDWFEQTHIVWLTTLGTVTLLIFLAHQMTVAKRGVINFTPFRSDDFAFAFIVSFVAGAALFGSAYLIPSFAVAVLAFTPTDAGQLLLPSGAVFIVALTLTALMIQFRRVPPFATVPFGILLIMMAMWMLSGSTSESGADDMMLAILLRGCGLGFLFLSITLIAFTNLQRDIALGIGLFNTGRQLGGLMGVGGLQTLIDHNITTNITVLGSHLSTGSPQLLERLATTVNSLTDRGMDAAAASRAATSLLAKAIAGQSTVIAFDTAFIAVAVLFVVAAPVLVVIKIGLHRLMQSFVDRPAI